MIGTGEKWRLDYAYPGSRSYPLGAEMTFPPKTPQRDIRKTLEDLLRQDYPRQDNETLTLRKIEDNVKKEKRKRNCTYCAAPGFDEEAGDSP